MRYKPHDYQDYATQFILDHPVAAIFLDCGLGKTVITLTAMEELLHDRFAVSRILIIAPLRVARDTWPAEIQKWEHLRQLTFAVAVGTERERIAALAQRAELTIINRENVDWLVSKSGWPFDFDMIVIDELSSFKSYQARRFRALMKARPLAKRVVGLTGTPSANGLMDLWAEFRLLDMGKRLGRFITHYREELFLPDKRNQQMVFSYKPRPGAEDEIYQRIGDITISMRSADYLKLPELVETQSMVKLSAKERKTYDAMRAEMVTTIGEQEIDAMNAAALSNKLLQMASGAVYDEDGKALHMHDRKLDALEDLVESANGRPVLVAYWYKHDAERIKERMPVREIRSSRDIRDWNAGKIPVALIHPAGAGHGLNLQDGGSMLIWFSLTWSLELYQQTNARLYRQGQKHTVTITHIIAEGTIDEQVMQALQKKDKTQAALIEAVKAELEVVK
jgi:SNF2 family DNA or RNA helicase